MTTKSLAHPAPPATTREQRGLELYRERAGEIRFEHGVWLVPSQNDATSVYEVRIGRKGESCECRDFERRGLPCKHVHAATIARAKTGRCGGCGGRFPRRDLVEAMEDDLGVFEGERYCRPCAHRCGVL